MLTEVKSSVESVTTEMLNLSKKHLSDEEKSVDEAALNKVITEQAQQVGFELLFDTLLPTLTFLERLKVSTLKFDSITIARDGETTTHSMRQAVKDFLRGKAVPEGINENVKSEELAEYLLSREARALTDTEVKEILANVGYPQ
jgi:hypothetical protein